MTAQASAELCAYVRRVAPPHVATSDAPGSWSALRAWHRKWRFLGDALVLPVFDGGCDSTIYPDAATNHAFRAWHDSTHLRLGASFSFADECAVALDHLKCAERAGLSVDDRAMLYADTFGQIAYYNAHGQYVQDQRAFVAACMLRGILNVVRSGDTY